MARLIAALKAWQSCWALKARLRMSSRAVSRPSELELLALISSALKVHAGAQLAPEVGVMNLVGDAVSVKE
jgi:hypothetical protein